MSVPATTQQPTRPTSAAARTRQARTETSSAGMTICSRVHIGRQAAQQSFNDSASRYEGFRPLIRCGRVMLAGIAEFPCILAERHSLIDHLVQGVDCQALLAELLP